LEVLRYAPEGDVPLAPYLSVTFNQPMVPLTSLQDLAARDVPVKLSPQPAGKWRWVGTKTLFFEPRNRFPMATKYTVEVPAGIVSATGSKLARAVSWTFTTPPPQLESFHPAGGPHPLHPLLFAAFNQRISPEDVLAKTTVSAGGKQVQVRLATAEEIKADKTVSRLADQAGEGRWLAFRSLEPFPPDTEVTVTFEAGTPSAEGPLTTESAQSFSFSTYGPLVVREHQCGWGDQCPPFAPWFIRFSNPLDETVFQADQVQIKPEVPGVNINVYGDTLQIQGRTSGRTRYQVTLSASLTDQFGQKLGKAQTLTFNVGSASPTIWAPGGNFITLDPYARPTYSVFTVNYGRLKVRAFAVQPEDWAAFKTYLQNYYRATPPPTPPGREVLSQVVPIQGKADELTETQIDLAPALSNGLGHLVLIVEPERMGLAALLPSRERPPVIQVWVQATHIGLDAFVDHGQMVAWANSLADGAPLADVRLKLWPTGETATTDRAGVATLPLPEAGSAALLVATRGTDTAFLPATTWIWGDGWERRHLADSLRWHVFDDRALYRPGDEVHVKGWIRRLTGGPTGDVEPLDGTEAQVLYVLRDSQGNEIQRGSTDVNALGGFDLALSLPDTMNLGNAFLELTYEGPYAEGTTTYQHVFQVQEFRRPEFEVKTAVETEGPHFVGGSAVIAVTASYYAGGALPNAEVTWQVTTAPGHYAPPNWDDFTFGRWVPWWRWYGGEPTIERAETYTGLTDAAGVHRLRLDFEAVYPPEPTTVTAQATVMDVNRQAWTSATTLLVHPANLYVGLRTERMFVEREEPLHVDAIVTDLDGVPIPGQKISMQAARLVWKYQDGRWQEVEAQVQPCTVQSAEEPVRCTFETPEGGTYRITATITDEQGRQNRSEITRWVSGGQRPPAREVEQEEVTLIPDRKDYQPGDEAEILIQAPFYPAEGLLTLRRSGLVSSQRFTMDGPTYTVRVPIVEAYTPNVIVQVDLVGAAPRGSESGGAPAEQLPKRPAYATGQLDLSVPPLARTLSLEVSPRDLKLEPGGETEVEVTVHDAAGRPVAGAELAVVVVDEAVLALTNYQLADPINTFYSARSADVADYHLRSSIVLASPEALLASGEFGQAALRAAMPMPMAAAPVATAAVEKAAEMPAMGAAAPGAPIPLRLDFNPLATFAPAVPTDTDGHAVVHVKLPDNLTRYRVMVVAVDASGKKFGKGESAITARLPLMVRPSPPRFLNFGDRFELPVVIQNQTDDAMQVDVAVRVANVRLVGGPLQPLAAGQRVRVPANDRVEVRFPAETDRAGKAYFQVAAVSGRWADAAQFELPVWTPATTEAFAVYGEVDQGAVAQPVIAPTNVFTQFGGLEITTSSTALQALTDAVLYLVSYPFECSEQLASRILAVAALRDVLTAFKAEGLPSPEEIEAAVARDIELLKGMQNDDGGFPTWRRGDESWPYHSIHVAHALQRARQKGYDVPEEMLARVQQYLRDIESHIPDFYSDQVRRTLIAYALNVRKQMGDADPARARALIQEAGLEKLSFEAIGWLLPVLSDDPASQEQVAAIRRYLLNRVTETAGAAHFVTSYGDDGYLLLHSDRRVDGILLDALIADQPDSDLIPKLVRGLLGHRKAGRWENTQENVFILLALDRYFKTYEAQTPDFVARIWLGEGYAGDVTFRGRTTEYRQINIPMSYIATTPQAQDLILSKEGAGRLYYRLGMRYAPTDLSLPAYEAGFTVARAYEAVDDPADVFRDEQGVWHIKAGARVRVRLTMVAPARRYHVALVDPLPAGLEVLNPALAVTGSIPQDVQSRSAPRSYWWWWRTWYEHQNLRDERVEAFASLLWEGVYTYSYVARATTPGRFVVPPAKAEEMYAPETFGRSAVDRVVVE